MTRLSSTRLSSTWAGQHLTHQVVDGVLEVTLHRDPLNEIGVEMLVELERVAQVLREGADGARAMLLSSAVDKGFSAGADLRELHDGLRQVGHGRTGSTPSLGDLGAHAARLLDSPRTAGLAGAAALWSSARSREPRTIARLAKVFGVRAFLDRIHRVFDTFDAAPIPTIAAVHGVCFGGGFELALTADVIVADKTARFAFPELRLGLIPGFGGIPRLERDLGNATVRDLLLSGRSLGARRAHEVGLVAQLVGEGHAVTAARRLAKQTERFDANTLRVAKRFLKPSQRARLNAEKAIFCDLVTSPVVEEALAAFVASSDAMPYLPGAPPLAPPARGRGTEPAPSNNVQPETQRT